jgi:hypothetical protein
MQPTSERRPNARAGLGVDQMSTTNIAADLHPSSKLEVFESGGRKLVKSFVLMYIFLGTVMAGGKWLLTQALPPPSEGGFLYQLFWSKLVWIQLYSGAFAMLALFMAVGFPFVAAPQIWRMLKHKPLLRIDEYGLWCRTAPELGFIPWSDIEGCRAAAGYLCVKFRDEAEYLLRAGKKYAYVKALYRLPDFPLTPMIMTTPSVPEVTTIINRNLGK